MKNKWYKKLISLSLVAVMALGLLAGCGSTAKETEEAKTEEPAVESSSETADAESSQESTEEEAGVTYPVDTDVTLTLAIQPHSGIAAHFESLQETPFWQTLCENTGVTVEVMEMDTNALELMLSSGDLPDMVWCNTSYLPGGANASIEDGIIISLTDYLDDYMPDLKALLETDEEVRKGVTTTGGDIYCAPMVRGDDSLLVTSGLIIREDWLNELGMEVPETPDELYEVLVAFKEKMGAEVPMSTEKSVLKSKYLAGGGITDGFGLISAGWYQVDGQIHYGYAEPELKDVYAYLNKLYNEKLLDPEFATIDSATSKSNLLTGRSGVHAGAVGGGIGNWMQEMADQDPEFALTGIPSLVSEKGTIARGSAGENKVQGMAVYITTACEYPEIAAQFLNYGYSEEGILYYNFGTEGVSYEMVGDYPTYADMVMQPEEGWTVQQAMLAYSRAVSTGPFVQRAEYAEQYAGSEQQMAAKAAWGNNTWNDHKVPALVTPEEYVDEYSKISSEISTYVDEMLVAYITGTKSLDTFESEYLATLESLGIDRMIEIRQMALDEYNAR